MGWGHQEQSDKLLATPQCLLLEREEKATHCLQPLSCKAREPLRAQKEGNRWCALLSVPMSVPSAPEGTNKAQTVPMKSKKRQRQGSGS